jgi:formylglycine-generating enzyme required for sulfatase activity
MTEEEILAAALEKPASERAAYLVKMCATDAAMRQRLERMLAAADKAGNFMARPAVVAGVSSDSATEIFESASTPNDAGATTGGVRSKSEDEREALAFLAPPGRPDSLGRIGHYEVLQVLGTGGFGIVYRAFDETLQRVVALKVMAPQLAATSPARKRFLREARSSAQVRHENVVQVYEVVEQPLPYLVMEFIPGETLQQRLDRVGPLDVPETLRIGRQIAEGLAAAHATDLIHRDIKPGNVLLEGGPRKVKITDFGLARAADDASISQSGIIAGTPMYMAPEQAKGETLDQRADLFSLGSVMYQMVAGRPPFRANTTVAVLKRVAEDNPRDIREIIPETPNWLCDIIAKLHAKNPDERFQSAREVADVLADCEAQFQANSKLKDLSRIPQNKPTTRPSGGWKWVVAAAMLLPLLVLVATEFAGVTHLFRGQQAKTDPINPGGQPTPGTAAKEAQEASAKRLSIPVETTNSSGMKFMLIPPGKFIMGSSKEEIGFWLKQNVPGWVQQKLLSEGPQHEVEITQPFYMGQTEVTVGQFRQFVTATGYKTQAEREGGARRHFQNGEWSLNADTNWLNPGFTQTDDHPVVCVSWNDAVAFCNWLSKKEGKNYRLPTEAEWEYGCRAGSTGRWFFGDNEGDLVHYARIGSNSRGHPSPAAGLRENAWGLHDLHGSVWQWCQDHYDANYYETSPPKDPSGRAAGSGRVVRGGSWYDKSWANRSACRLAFDPGDRSTHTGFRVVLVAGRTEIGAKDNPSSPVTTPFADADVQRIAALPAAEQVEEVRKELMKRNPEFDRVVEPTFEKDVVVGLKFSTLKVTDISPVRALTGLKTLHVGNWTRGKGELADLSPLKGMALVNLNCSSTKVSDLSPLKGMKLQELEATAIEASDLTPLQGMPLKQLGLHGLRGVTSLQPLQDMPLVYLNLSYLPVRDLSLLANMTTLRDLILQEMPVSDLTPLQGLKLRWLAMVNNQVSDLSPLRGMELNAIGLTPKNISKGMDILRDMTSLKTIGVGFDKAKYLPAAAFWERYDKGEFK